MIPASHTQTQPSRSSGGSSSRGRSPGGSSSGGSSSRSRSSGGSSSGSGQGGQGGEGPRQLPPEIKLQILELMDHDNVNDRTALAKFRMTSKQNRDLVDSEVKGQADEVVDNFSSTKPKPSPIPRLQRFWEVSPLGVQNAVVRNSKVLGSVASLRIQPTAEAQQSARGQMNQWARGEIRNLIQARRLQYTSKVVSGKGGNGFKTQTGNLEDASPAVLNKVSNGMQGGFIEIKETHGVRPSS